MDKHTKGPWKLETNEKSSSISVLGKHGDAGRVRQSDGHGHIVIVDCADAMESETMFAPMLDEQVANAHLIAAAPDLLEALKDCLDRFVTAFPAAAEYEPIKRGFAAIAKAERLE